jgi:hypothetical protein
LARLKRVRGSRLASIGPPAAAWALGTALTAAFTSQIAGWSVQSDELQLARLSISVADTLSLTPYLREEEVPIYSQLYPVLIAPFYGFLSTTAAFDAVHIFNAVAMASAAVPVYLLARELQVPKPAATVVAAASVMTPWMVLATLVFTEAVAYPAAAWAMLAIQRALAKPSPPRDLLALAAVALAFLARTQLLALGGLYLIVALVHGVAYPMVAAEGRDRLDALRRMPADLARGHPFLSTAALLGAVLLLRERSLNRLLGSYGGSTTGDLLPPRVGSFTLQHIDYIAVGVGVIPFVAAVGWAIAAGFRPASKGHHAFAVLMLVAVPLLSLQVSSFVLRYSASEIHDRYVMYLAPLLFLGLALFLYTDIRRSSFVGAAAAALAFFLVAEESDYVGGADWFASPVAVFHPVLTGRVDQLGDLLGRESLTPTPLLQLLAIATAIGLPLALRHLPRARVIAVVGLGVFAFSVVQAVYVFDKVLAQQLFVSGTDWIDERVPDDADVGLVPFPFGGYPPRVWWNVEFWNKRVTRAYETGDVDDFTPFPSGKLEIDERTGALTATEPLVRYLVMHGEDRRFRPRGSVTRERVTFEDDLELIELEQPAAAAWAAYGFGPDGTFHDGAWIRLYGGLGQGAVRQRVTLRVAASQEVDPALPRAPQERRRFAIRGAGVRRQGVLRLGEERAETLDVCVRRGSGMTLRLRGTGAGFHGAAPGIEGLPIGVKVASIEVADAPRPCSVSRAARSSRGGGRTASARGPAAP